MVGFYTAIRSRGLLVSLLASMMWMNGNGMTQLSALAQPAWEVSVNFPKASGNSGSPRQTTGAGNRNGTCTIRKDSQPGMTAIMPVGNIGTTVAANPSLSIYIPQTNAKRLEVVIAEVAFAEEEFKEVYVKSDFVIPVALKEDPGIITLKLDGANLEPNKLYKWTFTAFCGDANDFSKAEKVWGLFEPKELSADLRRQLEGATPLEQAKLYAQAGIWNETLALVSSLRASNPREWTELLHSIDLNNLDSAPLLESNP
ncbi:DUF928 domain-containing protein [Oscillatoria sp. FACHB-1406]|uniref:DUF928 domain-containing protein n=1 Tax=Oscillatoria sp. FACHB-1406 TaxID=2692846 RepID=UPI001683A99E|nr:DUF928 domain-containing protein [Oscillatoria sp. FACHB-1406]MBD2576861.1 DUF928 domain-containing protein [Oscillatoria sp. FACHB-1406]